MISDRSVYGGTAPNPGDPLRDIARCGRSRAARPPLDQEAGSCFVTNIFERPVLARARRVCLAFPETAETASWGHPNFRAGKKTFCTFEIVGGRPSIAIRLAPADVDRALRRNHFFATPYGRGAWASVCRLEGASGFAIEFTTKDCRQTYQMLLATRRRAQDSSGG